MFIIPVLFGLIFLIVIFARALQTPKVCPYCNNNPQQKFKQSPHYDNREKFDNIIIT